MAGAPSQKARLVRIIVLGTGFIFLVGLGLTIALRKPTDQDIVEDQVKAMIGFFQRQDVEQFVSGVTDPVLLIVDGQSRLADRDAQRRRLAYFYGGRTRISISPKKMKVAVRNGSEAAVSFPFKYASSETSILGMRGDPKVDLALRKEDGVWLISEIRITTP